MVTNKFKPALFAGLLYLFMMVCSSSLLAQTKPDTLQKSSSDTSRNSPTSKKPKQKLDSITNLGVAVSPSSLRFKVKPGTSATQVVTITNDSKKTEKFKISFADFTMNDGGSTSTLPINQNAEFGLSKYISATPSFVELTPGEIKKVTVTINLPDQPENYKAAWCVMMVDETKERTELVPEANENTIAMGVIPVFGFGVYIFQNPPNVTLNKVEITNFVFNYDKENKYVSIFAKNVGTGIGFCNAYIEITNTKTGQKTKHDIKKFTILPGNNREISYTIPGKLEKGNYSILAVLDFGSKEEIEAAEIEVNVP